MNLWFRRTLVVTGCLSALAGGVQALQAAGKEPPPPSPLVSEAKLNTVLATELKDLHSLDRTQGEQAAAAQKLSSEQQSLEQQVGAGLSQLSSVPAATEVQVQSVTGSSGGSGDDGATSGDDGGGGGDD